MTGSLLPFLNGGLVVACLAVGLVFVKFWRVSRDRFFLFFAAAFWAFAFGAGLRTFFASANEHDHFVFLPRLVGFVIILFAILDKNRRRPE